MSRGDGPQGWVRRACGAITKLYGDFRKRRRRGVDSKRRGGTSQRNTCLDERELDAKLEVLHAMREGATVESLEPGLVGGCITAAREPRAIEPVERAQLDLDGTRDVDFGYRPSDETAGTPRVRGGYA